MTKVTNVLEAIKTKAAAEAALLISVDGQVLATTSNTDAGLTAIATYAANYVSVSERMGEDTQRGAAQAVILIYRGKAVVLAPLGRSAVALIVGSRGAHLGNLRHQLQKGIGDLARAVVDEMPAVSVDVSAPPPTPPPPPPVQPPPPPVQPPPTPQPPARATRPAAPSRPTVVYRPRGTSPRPTPTKESEDTPSVPVVKTRERTQAPDAVSRDGDAHLPEQAPSAPQPEEVPPPVAESPPPMQPAALAPVEAPAPVEVAPPEPEPMPPQPEPMPPEMAATPEQTEVSAPPVEAVPDELEVTDSESLADPLLQFVEPERPRHPSPLADLANFATRIDHHLEDMRRNPGSFSLAVLALEGFGEISPPIGRAAREDLVHLCAKRLQKAMRSADIATQFDDATFGILLGGVKSNQAKAVVQRVTTQVLEDNLDQPREKVTFRIRAGTVTYPEGGSSADRLLRRARTSLFISQIEGAISAAKQHPAEFSVAVLALESDEKAPRRRTPSPMRNFAIFAQRLERTLRAVDIATQIEDRKFGILLMGVTHAQAVVIVQRIRDQILKDNLGFPPNELGFRLRAGIATYPETGPLADGLLYHAESTLAFLP